MLAELFVYDCSAIADACISMSATQSSQHSTALLVALMQEELHVLDSGASDHMTLYCHTLTNYCSIEPIPINAANNTTFSGIG
jgi:hypothetical protein